MTEFYLYLPGERSPDKRIRVGTLLDVIVKKVVVGSVSMEKVLGVAAQFSADAQIEGRG